MPWLLLVGILALGGWGRFQQLGTPNGYLFDEHYHVPTAKLIARGDGRAWEYWHGELINEGEVSGSWIDWLHPPLNKYGQAAAMKILGEESAVAWRLSAAASGVILIALVYWLGEVSFRGAGREMGRWVGLGAAWLVAVDPLLVLMSRIGMNDMLVTTLMVGGVIMWQYWRWSATGSGQDWGWWLMTAVVFGLAVGTKWSAALILPLILFLSWADPKLEKIRDKIIYSVVFALVIGLVYLVIYGPFFWSGKTLVDFYALNEQILRYQLLNNLTHAAAATPWEWMIGQKEIWLTTRPEHWAQPIILRENIVMIVLGLGSAIAATGVLGWQILGKKKATATGPKTKIKLENLFIITALYWTAFLPWALSPRPMFLYHYLPALPFLLILIAFWGWHGGTAIIKVLSNFQRRQVEQDINQTKQE